MSLIPTFEENQIGDISVGVGFQVFGSNEIDDIAGCTTFIQRSIQESVKKDLPKSINNVPITPIKNSENKTVTFNFKLIMDFHSEDGDWDRLTPKEQAVIVGFTAAASKALCLEKMDELDADYRLEHDKWLEDND